MAAATDRSRQRAEARRRELAERQRHEARRRLLLRILLPVGLVVAVVAVFVVVKVATGGGSTPAADGVIASGAAPASVVQTVTSVPTSAFDTVGVSGDATAPTPIANGTDLTADGKPRVLYVGGEFCPFCAAERWVTVVALSRFGTFADLGQTNSSADDVHPNTATLSFSGASYTSEYLAFDGYETTDRERKPLDTLPAADETQLQQLDTGGSIPFQDLGGKFSQTGAGYDPSLLADKTHAQIAQAIADPSSDIAKAVLSAANLYTARLCTLTDGQPGEVCTSPGVTAATSSLGS